MHRFAACNMQQTSFSLYRSPKHGSMSSSTALSSRRWRAYHIIHKKTSLILQSHRAHNFDIAALQPILKSSSKSLYQSKRLNCDFIKKNYDNLQEDGGHTPLYIINTYLKHANYPKRIRLTKKLTHSVRNCWPLGRLMSTALRPVTSSTNTTPKLYTSAFSVICPLCAYSGAR